MRWIVPYDLPFFNGHFPEGSILPSVISLEASLELIGLALKKEKVFLTEVKTAKWPSRESGLGNCQTADRESEFGNSHMGNPSSEITNGAN